MKNLRYKALSIIVIFVLSITLAGCTSTKTDNNKPDKTTQNPLSTEVKKTQTNKTEETQPQIDVNKVQPNESGKIMVVMFHNFIETYKKGDKDYTTTFDEFRNLLQKLYDSGYRLINLDDFLDNNINVPAGCIPIVFTFDDGTAGQFNLVEENGILTANKQSAVGIMEEFNKTHPDFGLKGTFYVNLGGQTFRGKGTVAERLKYLIDKGFEIGNHTLNHIYLKKAKSAEQIQKEIGGNQKKMYELVTDYTFKTLSLPKGGHSKEFEQYVIKGEYEGVKYENFGIMEVGAEPSVSVLDPKFNSLSIRRVRASGIVPVEADLAWWIKKMSRKEQYVSDGNPDTITIPKGKESKIVTSKLNNKKLIIY